MISLLTSLLLSAPAFAQDTQSTAMTSQQVATLLLQQQERLAAAEARAKRAEKALAQAKTESAQPAQQTVVVERVEPAPAPAADPRIAALEAELAQANADYAALAAAVSALGNPVVNVTVEPTPVTVNVAAPEVKLSPVVLRTETTQVEVRSSGFHPIFTLGGSLVIAGPVPDVSEVVAGRVTLGVRPTWDLAGTHAFGLTVEADKALGGWGVRGIPTYLTYGSSGGWGVGVGAAYNCDALTDQGCLAEHTGGVGRVSWEKGGKVAGVLLNADLEINYLTIPGAGAIEARGVLGANVYFGNARPKTVTVQ